MELPILAVALLEKAGIRGIGNAERHGGGFRGEGETGRRAGDNASTSAARDGDCSGWAVDAAESEYCLLPDSSPDCERVEVFLLGGGKEMMAEKRRFC